MIGIAKMYIEHNNLPRDWTPKLREHVAVAPLGCMLFSRPWYALIDACPLSMSLQRSRHG